MLQLVEKLNNPIKSLILRRSSILKLEDNAYVSAFLTSLRQRLLPHHSNSLKLYPPAELVNEVYKEIYSELNELYVDEHVTMANNDYVEQCYDIFSKMHQLIRKYDLVYDLNLEENKKRFKTQDPDEFPVYDLTGNRNKKDYKSIWDLYPDLLGEFEDINGFRLVLKKSRIEHEDAGDGVFIHCENFRFILPGTLLGFYPGMIYNKSKKTPEPSVNSTLPFLKRPNGTWVDPNFKIPYPFNQLLSYSTWKQNEEISQKLRGMQDFNYNLIAPALLNPLALGDKINHPPPDISPNVKFIDIEIPHSFFPSDFIRYFPNVLNEDSKTLKLTGVVSTTEIKHKEELYIDYIEEDMIPQTFRPDWLLSPPPRNPYLIKKEYVSKPNLLDEMVNKIYMITQGKELKEYKEYIKRDEGLDIIRANASIKSLQEEIKSKGKLINEEKEKLKLL